jgi:long-chain acyl-CoA synthetase
MTNISTVLIFTIANDYKRRGTMRTIIRMLDEAAKRYPQRAYTTKKEEKGWVPTTYPEINQLSDYFASYLLDNKIEKESTFGLLAEGRTEWIVAEMGVLKARSISVPLSIKLTSDEIAFRLKHSEAKGIIASSNTLDNVCKALETMEEKPILYYLDSLDDRLKRQIEKLSWQEGKDFVVYEKIISEGKKIFDKNPSLVQ